MDPFWDTIQTNCLFFTFSVLGDLRGSTVPSALKRTAMAPAHKPICSCIASAFGRLVGGTLHRARVFLGSWKTSCCLSGALDGQRAQRWPYPCVPGPSSTGTSWRERSFAFQSKSTCFFNFYLRSRRPFVLFLFSLRKKPAPQLNRDCNPVAK